MASILKIGSAPTAIILSNPCKLPNGACQISFNNTAGLTFTALATTNPLLPMSSWEVLGGVTEVSPGHYEFNHLQVTNNVRYFYRVRSP
jgi:hypothetical protein